MDDDRPLTPVRLAQERPFRLGAVEVTPALRQITRAGASEVLEPRVMQVLVALAQAQGTIVSRDDLIIRCWDGRIVGDNAIHRAASKIRELGQVFAAGAFRLETVTKVGYRLIVPQSETVIAPASSAAATSFTKDEPPARSANRRRLAGAIVAGAGLAVIGAAGMLVRPSATERKVAALIERSEQAMRDGLPEGDMQGVGFLQEAVALRPEDPRPWGKLALARGLVAEHAPPDRTSHAVAATQEAARRALALDPRQIDALSALALLPPYYGAWYAAERRMNAVLALDREHLPTRNALAFMFAAVGRLREGCLDRVVLAEREPLHAVHQFRLIYALWMLGRDAEADRAADRALQLWPKHQAAWLARLWTFAFTGRVDRALAHVDDAAGRPPFPPPMVEALRTSMLALRSRRSEDADLTEARLLGLLSQGPSHSVHAIMILAGLGRIDAAFSVADAYLLERGPLMASVRWRDGQVSINDMRRRLTNMLFLPVTAPMRADPRFLALVDDMGLTAYWSRVGVRPDFLA